MPNPVKKSDVIEQLAASVHERWRRKLRRHKVSSRLSHWGEELLRPYAELSPRAKQLNRDMVRQVLHALDDLI